MNTVIIVFANAKIVWKFEMLDIKKSVTWPFKRQSRKMVKHTQTVRRQFVFHYFVGLVRKGLNLTSSLFVLLAMVLLLRRFPYEA